MQALFDGQSELSTHSGRQLGTEPIIPDTHPHWAWPETTWHCEFGPHGDGVQGLGGMGRNVPSSTTGFGTGATNVKLIRLFTNVQYSEVVRQFSGIMLTRNNVTTSKRITSPSRRTHANRVVINYTALSISTTGSRTGILTFEVDTRLRRCALWAWHTFRSTFWWYTKVAWLTRTDRSIADLTALTIWTARCWYARSFYFTWRCYER
jgi:hypothetical protein